MFTNFAMNVVRDLSDMYYLCSCLIARFVNSLGGVGDVMSQIIIMYLVPFNLLIFYEYVNMRGAV